MKHRENLSKTSVDNRSKIFQGIEKTLSLYSALKEASRCLFCYDAPCVKGCPAGIDVTNFIRKIKTKNYIGAISIIREANPFGSTCARICPSEVLCEKECSRGGIDSPIAIGKLQQFITDIELKKGIKPINPKKKKNKKVGIIGSGPSGISCAWKLAKMGYQVVVFEKKQKLGGLLRYGIPRYRLPEDILQKEIDAIEKNIEIKTSIDIGKEVPLDSILAKYDAVFLACGLGKAAKMNITGENLKGVIMANEFLYQVNSREKPCFQNKTVAVIGGGNTAMDCACLARQFGSKDVKIIYRRSKIEIPAWEREYKLASEEGVEFHWLTLPRVIRGDRKVERIECIKMKLGEPDESGRQKPIQIPGSKYEIKADIVIEALGQKLDEELVSKFNIRTKNGRVIVNEETCQTSNPKIFAGGDVINGGKTAVQAIGESKRAAYGINVFLSNKRIIADVTD